MRAERNIASGFILQQVFSGLAFLLVTRTLGAKNFGMVATAQALAMTAYTFGGYSIAPYIIRFGTKQILNQGALYDTYLKGCTISLGITLLGGGGAFLLSHYHVLDAGIPFKYLFLLILGIGTVNLLRNGLQATQSFRLFGLSLWADRFMYLLVISTLAFYRLLSSQTAVSSSAICMLAVAAAGMGLFLSHFVKRSSPAFDFHEFRKFSLPIMFGNFANYLSSGAMMILITSRLMGKSEAAWVSTAFVAAGLLLQPISWITPTLLPKFTLAVESKNPEVVRKHLTDLLLPASSLFSFGVMMAILLGPLVPKLMGPTFAQARPVIGAVLAAYGGELINMLLVQVLYAHDRQVLVLMSCLLKGGIALSCSLVFVRYGVAAICIAVLLGYWAQAIIEMLAVGRQVNVNLWVRVLPIGLVAAIPSVLGLFVQGRVLLVVAAVGTVITAAALLRYRALFKNAALGLVGLRRTAPPVAMAEFGREV
jgi:O-antigen/teichoic acid export membrane protein